MLLKYVKVVYCPVQKQSRSAFCFYTYKAITLRLIINSDILWSLTAYVIFFLWHRINVKDSERKLFVYTKYYLENKNVMWIGQAKHVPMFSFLEPDARGWSGGKQYWWGFQRKTHRCRNPCMPRKQVSRLCWTLTFQKIVFLFFFFFLFYFSQKIADWGYEWPLYLPNRGQRSKRGFDRRHPTL